MAWTDALQVLFRAVSQILLKVATRLRLDNLRVKTGNQEQRWSQKCDKSYNLAKKPYAERVMAENTSPPAR